MGFIFKVLIFFVVIYMIINFFTRFFFGTRRKPTSKPYGQSRQPEKEPESQEERILDYQKKSFEVADAQDVEFEEIKHKDANNQ